MYNFRLTIQFIQLRHVSATNFWPSSGSTYTVTLNSFCYPPSIGQCLQLGKVTLLFTCRFLVVDFRNTRTEVYISYSVCLGQKDGQEPDVSTSSKMNLFWRPFRCVCLTVQIRVYTFGAFNYIHVN
jgi:hypothetical protein